MPRGATQPTYILPFDHRAAFVSGMFGWAGALDPEQSAQIAGRRRLSEYLGAEIARRYRQWVDTCERARAAAGSLEAAFATARATLTQG